MCKFGQNPPVGSKQSANKAHFYRLNSVVTLKIGHQNLIKSFNYPNDTIHKVWPESIIWFKRQDADKPFCSKIDIQSAGVTLKMR